MRRRLLSMCLVAASFALLSARGDVLILSNGGHLNGTLSELEFLSGGDRTKSSRDQITGVIVSGAAKDALTLKDGTKLSGEVSQVRFKSVGGDLPFERKELAGLTIGEEPREAARKELATRRLALAAKDAKAVYELAAWCRDKELKPESAEMARQCLALGPDAELAPKAHELAGDVLHDGQWLTPAEYAKVKGQEPPAEPVKNPPKENPPPKEPVKPKPITDGVFNGSAQGFKSTVAVSVKVANDKIASVKVTSHQDDRPRTSIVEIPKRIVAKQDTSVDVVTGASITSRAIMKAASEALAGRTRKPAEGIADGVYTGAAKGYVADVKVSVRVKNERIESVRIVQTRENRARTALVDIPERIADHQSVDVDVVTHASITSRAVMAAVKDALASAKQKP